MKTKLIKSTTNPFLRAYGNVASSWTIRLLRSAMVDDKHNIFTWPLASIMNHSLKYADFYEVIDWELGGESNERSGPE